MHHLLLLFLIDLLQQVPLQCLVLLFPIEVVSLQLIVNLVVIVLHIPIEQVIQLLVVHFMELGQIGLLLHVLGVLGGDLLLAGHTLVHSLHVVILILKEG